MHDRRAAYFDYLHSPHWKQLKLHVFRMAGNHCEVCTGNNRLVGHHLRYREKMEDGIPEDIMCMCEDCHDLWHAWMKENGKGVDDYNRASTIDKLRNLFIRRIKKLSTPNPNQSAESVHIDTLLDQILPQAPPTSPKSKQNWAVKRIIHQLRTEGRLTPQLRIELMKRKSGARAKRWIKNRLRG